MGCGRWWNHSTVPGVVTSMHTVHILFHYSSSSVCVILVTMVMGGIAQVSNKSFALFNLNRLMFSSSKSLVSYILIRDNAFFHWFIYSYNVQELMHQYLQFDLYITGIDNKCALCHQVVDIDSNEEIAQLGWIVIAFMDRCPVDVYNIHISFSFEISLIRWRDYNQSYDTKSTLGLNRCLTTTRRQETTDISELLIIPNCLTGMMS